jgi:dihydropteroate synthase
MDDRFRARRDAFLRKIGVRPVVMGILNLTPDSFSDGGRFSTSAAAVTHAAKLFADGCDIVDVGGESTRPDATAVSAADELARVEPFLAQWRHSQDNPLSIDTYKAAVAARALALGAVLVNDVWGLQKDEGMADTVAQAQAAVVVMHNRVEKDPNIDILSDIRRFFDRSLERAARAGIPREHIILDPGIAFGKTSRQNRDVIARLGELRGYGLPIMVGVSRKSFLGSLSEDGTEASLVGTVAANLAAAARGAAIFRVHDVAEHVAALKIFSAIDAVVPAQAGAHPPFAGDVAKTLR